jgi:hypothetical protein
MKIYDTKTIDVGVNGKLRRVSLKQLLRLIVDGKTPAISRQGHADLKKLIWLLAQIQIEGVVVAITVGGCQRLFGANT